MGWCGDRGVTGWRLRATCGEGHVEGAECACSRRVTSAGAEGKVGVVECRCWLCSMETQSENAVLRGGRACSCSSIWVNAVRRTRWCAARCAVVLVGRALVAGCGRCAAIHLHRCFLVKGFYDTVLYIQIQIQILYSRLWAPLVCRLLSSVNQCGKAKGARLLIVRANHKLPRANVAHESNINTRRGCHAHETRKRPN